MESRNRLGSPRPGSLVDRGSGREVPPRKRDSRLEPRCLGRAPRQLEVLGLAAEDEHQQGQVAEPPFVQPGSQGQELVDQLIGLAPPPVEQERPGAVVQRAVKLLRVLHLTGELEAALRIRECAGQIALGQAHAARHHQDRADEVVAFASHRHEVLACGRKTSRPSS